MAIATDEQIQHYVDQRVRPSCSALVLWYYQQKQNKASIDDVYNNLTGTPDWTDTRTDGVAHLAVVSDVLAWNSFISNMIDVFEGNLGDSNAKAAAVDAIRSAWAVVMSLPAVPVPTS